jgi:hypothetical protein
MRHFLKVAEGLDLVLLQTQLHRQPALWGQHTARTGGMGPFIGTDDIWVRFRAPEELDRPEAFAEPFVPVFYPAWFALPALRPIVFALMARLEAVELGGILITRIPAGQQVKPHDDRGRWHPEHYLTKCYIPLLSNPFVVSTCAEDIVVMQPGECWIFDNLKTHSTVNDGTTDRVTLIVSLRCA